MHQVLPGGEGFQGDAEIDRAIPRVVVVEESHDAGDAIESCPRSGRALRP